MLRKKFSEATRFQADGVRDAIRQAEEFKRQGTYDLFRGQSGTWPLVSSLNRLDELAREAAVKRSFGFIDWVKRTPGVEQLAAEPDAVWAVGQHYGLRSNFIDFTTEPEVAGFFASSDEEAEAGQASCIICVNTKDIEKLQEIWFKELELLYMEIADLWRLEAQHGCFLHCPYKNLDERYPFDRIVFPYDHDAVVVPNEDIYPERKSDLETLLDHYFMQERVEADPLEDVLEAHRIELAPVSVGAFRVDPLPELRSWNEAILRPWVVTEPEKWSTVRSEETIVLRVDEAADFSQQRLRVSAEVSERLASDATLRASLLKWSVDVASDEGQTDLGPRLEQALALLWDGLRRLPYTGRRLGGRYRFLRGLGSSLRAP